MLREVGNRGALLIAVPIVVLVTGILIWSLFGQRESLALMPLLPDPTTVIANGDQSPVTVTFTELNDDPVAYLSKIIIVSGSYLPLERNDCLRYTGPDIRWSLTAENLQLDALGFERIVRLLPIGTEMTVQGIWRIYEGPLGCGKGPPEGTAWYLDVKKILQPNPLVSERGQALPVIVGNNDPRLPQLLPTLDFVEGVPTETADSIATPETAGTIPPTPEGQITLTVVPTLAGSMTPTPTLSQLPTSQIPTATSIPGTTVPGATMTPTATIDPSQPTPTFTPEQPPVLATATDVPGGYPGPTVTAVPTATPRQYP